MKQIIIAMAQVFVVPRLRAAEAERRQAELHGLNGAAPAAPSS